MSQLETDHWSHHPDLVDFYSTHRNRPEDLYPSEKRFLPWVAQRTRTVLDIGCAAGGFRSIWQHFQPQIHYTGVDLSPELLRSARQLNPTGQFIQADCARGLPMRDRTIDTVQSFGALHWEKNYGRALDEMWRVSDRFVLFDMRLTNAEDDKLGEQKVAFCGPWDQQTTTPYVCVSWKQFAQRLISLEPERILGFGYRGQAAETVIGIEHDLCFGVFLLIKPTLNAARKATEVCLELPMEWPSEITGAVKTIEKGRLSSLVPES